MLPGEIGGHIEEQKIWIKLFEYLFDNTYWSPNP